jgi:transglutaminase-like putative cysteine protease
MSDVTTPSEPALDAVQLLDHRGVTWCKVRETHYWIHKRFHYAYPGPIHELRQRLVVLPPERHGDQLLLAHSARVLGPQALETSSLDGFGNHVLLFYIPEAPGEVTFEVTLEVARAGCPALLPSLDAAQAERFRAETELTAADKRIAEIAKALAARHYAPVTLAEAINTYVWQTMQYGWGVTHVGTSAAEALALGQGLCQDYAHIMLAICRAAGLPARYVSGHLLGEGGSHAWVEVLLPREQGGFAAVPFDPTNHRRANLSYVTIAVGRDYRGVSPTSGSYVAAYQGRLTASKRAGLTRVEYAAA